MATITQRTGRNGEKRYTAQIRMQKDGRRHTESETFGSKKAAQVWAKKREAELEANGLPKYHDGIDVATACAKLVEDLEKSPRGLGRSKRLALLRMSKTERLAEITLSTAKAADWLSFMMWRFEEGHALGEGLTLSPATVNEDFQYLNGLLEHARIAWGANVSMQEIQDAGTRARRMGLIDKSEGREVRPSIDDLDAIFSYFTRPVTGRGTNNRTRLPVIQIFLFQIFSTRRISETVSLRWDDLDTEHQRILVRKMKHPRAKDKNDTWVHLPDRALALIEQQPRTSEFIWPYAAKSVAAQWQRACVWARMENLALHDLRHEGISHLFELGWDIPRVAMVSGHKSWDTLRRYTHMTNTKSFDKYARFMWFEYAGIK